MKENNIKVKSFLKDELNSVGSIWHLLYFLSINLIKKSFQKTKKPNKFPTYIHSYKLISVLPSSPHQPNVSAAIYQSRNMKKLFAKMWSGSNKDYYYYSCINEIRAFNLLAKVVKRTKKLVPKSLQNIQISPLVYLKVSNRNVLYAREYKSGKTGFELDSKTKLLVYFKIIDYLSFLVKHMTPAEKKLFPHRGPLSYLILYPVILFRASISYPNFIPVLYKNIPLVLSTFIQLFNNNMETITHRDLHFKNIILSGKTVVLVDFQYCVITDLFQELTTTLRYRWGMDNFQKLFLNEIAKRYKSRKNFKVIFKGFLINNITHAFTSKKFSTDKIHRWIDLAQTADKKIFLNS